MESSKHSISVALQVGHLHHRRACLQRFHCIMGVGNRRRTSPHDGNSSVSVGHADRGRGASIDADPRLTSSF